MLPPGAPSKDGPPDAQSKDEPPIHRVCSLWVHSSTFSRDEVLFNAALLPRAHAIQGRLLKIRPSDQSSRSEPFVFVARDLSDEQRSKYPNLQVCRAPS